MPASEIVRIAVTIGVVQIIIDAVAHWRIFSREPYQRSLEKLGRSNFNLQALKTKEEKAASDALNAKGGSKSKVEKNAKKMQRTIDDNENATADVARRHTLPNLLGSIVTLILMRILGTELQGKVIALLPFAPASFLKRVTARSLEFMEDADFVSTSDKVTDLAQCASFTFVYFLCALSVKFYVHQLFGTKPPAGVDGIMSVVNSPMGRSIVNSVGLDPVDFKQE